MYRKCNPLRKLRCGRRGIKVFEKRFSKLALCTPQPYKELAAQGNRKIHQIGDEIRMIAIPIFSVLLFCFILFFLSMRDTDSKDLGNDFVYSSEHKHILGKIDIPPAIIWYDYDKYFIVAKQRPEKFHKAIYDKKEYVYTLGRDIVYYWLVIKQEQKVFGPLDYDSFQQLKKKYEVPDKLILK